MFSRLTRGISFVALTAVVASGCGDGGAPLAPEAPEAGPEPSFSRAASTPFAATWTNTSVVDLPPPPAITGGAAHFWNDVNSGPITGGLEGTVIAVSDLNGSFAAGKGPLTGTMEFVLDGGGFIGRFAGIFNFAIGLSEGHFTGKGTGAYAGQKINGTYSNAPGGLVFAMEGHILNPNP